LADAAWRQGITVFVATTLMQNREMMGVFVDSGFPVTTMAQNGVVDVRFPIEPSQAYRSTRAKRHPRSNSELSGQAPPC
jgi:hypothetical protein